MASTTGGYTSRGLRLAYEDVGAGPAVLFLHAFPLSRQFWRHQVGALATDGFRAIVPDLSGFGESAAVPEGQPCRMEDFAADAVALLDHLGVDRAVVCGCSMGGYAALALAETRPERLRALVLADSRSGADAADGREKRLDMARRVVAEGTGFVAEAMIPKLLGKTSHERRPELREWLERQIAAAPPAGVAAAQRGMAERPDRGPLLPRIAVPALIVVGEEDEITPPVESERMAGEIPGARLVVIPEAGHLASLERPDVFNGALRDFLRDLPEEG
jgi:3-oxoadipate enol-lactonase